LKPWLQQGRKRFTTEETIMERVISNLLSDFERGKLTRRQLIKSLAITVSAATAAGAPSATAGLAPGGGFKAITVNHISYQVADYARTRDFYAGLLGMHAREDNGTQCFLTFGDSYLIPRNRPSNTPRIDHIAYTIDNWDKKAVEAELKRRGLDPKPDTDNSFHVLDPNGFDLQISGKEMKP
jgi:catechol 2,3-dioxygenase-like lactoylglutathione lyase family enzyme